jgi:hypothetical protein
MPDPLFCEAVRWGEEPLFASVSTLRYFGPCPTCGRRIHGGEITYDVPPREIDAVEQTHWCAFDGSLPPTVLTACLIETARAEVLGDSA